MSETGSEDYKRARGLMLTIKEKMEAQAKGMLEIAVALNELEDNSLYRSVDPNMETMEEFAKKYFRISRSCYFNYKKLTRFCVRDEVSGRFIPKIRDEFRHLNVTELYSFKTTDKPAVKKTRSKKFTSKEKMLEWLQETGVTPESLSVQYLDFQTDNGKKGTAMEVGSEDHRIANPAEESVA